jgi:hypothetical protein
MATRHVWLENAHQPTRRTYTSKSSAAVVSPQLSRTRRNKSNCQTAAKTAFEAWACDIVLIGKRLEGCDKIRQAHQASEQAAADWRDFSTALPAIATYCLPLPLSIQISSN